MYKLSLLAVFCLGAASQSFADPVNIGIIYSSDFESNVYSQLNSTGLYNITQIDASSSTPTLAQLDTFSAVLVYSDGTFANSDQLGDELDTYLRAGGNVVTATFATNIYAELDAAGAFLSNGDYALLPGEQISVGADTLGTIYQPNSPLLAGVTSFNGGESGFASDVTVNPNATEIAAYASGTPLEATMNVGSGVSTTLNFYPPSSDIRPDFWVSSTDGTQLLVNALGYNGVNVGVSATPEPSSLVLLGSGAAGLFGMMRRKLSKRS